MLSSLGAAPACAAPPARALQQRPAGGPLLQQTTRGRRQATALRAASSAPSAVASQQVLLDQQRRELETEARRRAFAAQREAEIEAERRGLSWWDADCPPNMRGVASLDELRAAVETAPPTQLVVVNFFAPECYACRSLQPKLRQLARGHPGVLFLKVNGLEGDLRGYVEAMQITKIPYFHMYKANARVAEFTANMRPEKLALLRSELAAHGGSAEAAVLEPAPAAAVVA